MRTPVSTYRLQITESFDLLEAARRLGYLHELGVDWVYLSPLLSSESGSEHGYDVADHGQNHRGGAVKLPMKFAQVFNANRFDLADQFLSRGLAKRIAFGKNQLRHPIKGSNARVFLLVFDVGDDPLLHLFQFVGREGRLSQFFGERRDDQRQIAVER